MAAHLDRERFHKPGHPRPHGPVMKASAAPLALHVFSTFAVGGPQVRFAAIANHLGNAFRHIVVAMDGNYGCAERLAPDLNVVYPHVLTRKRATLQNARTFRQVLRDFRRMC